MAPTDQLHPARLLTQRRFRDGVVGEESRIAMGGNLTSASITDGLPSVSRQAGYLEERLVALGLDGNIAKFYEKRRAFSESQISEFSKRLQKSKHLSAFDNLLIYSAGSYARGEASPFSDIDLFFIHNDIDNPEIEDPRLKGIRAIASVIREMEEGMDFPPPSNDGQFLSVVKLSDVLEHLGGMEDDYRNHFTARMLLMLESRVIYSPDDYRSVMSKIVESYMRDYGDHIEEFRTTFLVNDILRYWRTLCLNYEHKRNQETEARKTKQKIKNFKLGFSRLSTCFSTVALLSSYNKAEPEELVEIFHLPPIERFLRLSDRVPATRPLLITCLTLYAWFLEQTALPPEEIVAMFEDSERRGEAFRRAREFGENMFNLTRTAAEESGTFRYLVI
ncbi:Nucleotidyltransferase domain protein [compost metagenome]